MAMLADAIHQISEANAILEGSVKHQENRRHLVTPFLRFLRDELKSLTRSLADIRPWHVHIYAVHRIVSGATPGHMGNEFSAIRVVCRALGNNISKSCSNRQLGLPLRVRKGARRAQSQEEIRALLERAARLDQGLVHLIALARLLGLRRLEALMCARDLRMWRDALLSGKTTLHIMRGAKNLRPREAEVLESQRAETLAAIEAALEYAVEHNYELITGRGRTLESALNRLKGLLHRLGMVGKLSFHSRLQLLCGLPDALLAAVRRGVVSTWAATRVLAPLARANAGHATQLLVSLEASPLSTRELRCWFGHYRVSSHMTREHLVASPRLFIESWQARDEQRVDVRLRDGPEGQCATELRQLLALISRLRQRLPQLQPTVQGESLASALRHLRTAIDAPQADLRRYLDHDCSRDRPERAHPAGTGPQRARDRPPAQALTQHGAPGAASAAAGASCAVPAPDAGAAASHV